MTAYRKKPVTVEAEQWLGHKETPMECVLVLPKSWAPSPNETEYGLVATSLGTTAALPGDWVITGASGVRSVCKPDLFAATYEPADTPPVHEKLVERLKHMLSHFCGSGERTFAMLQDVQRVLGIETCPTMTHKEATALEACEAFVEAWERTGQWEKTDVALRKARAAIAEAGETP